MNNIPQPIPEYPQEIKSYIIKINKENFPKIIKQGDYLFKKNKQ